MNDHMIDLGRKYESPVVASEPAKNKVDYPMLYISSDQPLMDVDAGEEVYALVVLKKVRGAESEDETGKCRYSCDYEVRAIKVLGDVDEDGEDDTDTPEESALEALARDMLNARAGGTEENE